MWNLPRPGVEPVPPALAGWILNYWTTGEALEYFSLIQLRKSQFRSLLTRSVNSLSARSPSLGAGRVPASWGPCWLVGDAPSNPRARARGRRLPPPFTGVGGPSRNPLSPASAGTPCHASPGTQQWLLYSSSWAQRGALWLRVVLSLHLENRQLVVLAS